MKKHLKRLLASLLSLTLILGATAVTAFAVEPAESEEAITIDMEKSGFDEEAGVFNLYLTINETASGDLTVDLASQPKRCLISMLRSMAITHIRSCRVIPIHLMLS